MTDSSSLPVAGHEGTAGGRGEGEWGISAISKELQLCTWTLDKS